MCRLVWERSPWMIHQLFVCSWVILLVWEFLFLFIIRAYMLIFLSLHTAIKSPRGVNLVASLCKLYDASEADVKDMLNRVNSMIQSHMESKYSLKTTEKERTVEGIDIGNFSFSLMGIFHRSQCQPADWHIYNYLLGFLRWSDVLQKTHGETGYSFLLEHTR